MTTSGDGSYTAAIDLSYAGEWRLDMRVRPSKFESLAGTTTISIAAA